MTIEKPITLLGMSAGLDGRVIVLGAPFDHAVHNRNGCAIAPATLRVATSWLGLSQGHIFLQGPRKRALQGLSISDAGDLPPLESETVDEYLQRLTSAVAALLTADKIPFVLGGDHLITWAVLRGIETRYPSYQVVHIDAHSDVQSLHRDSRANNANFVTFAARSPSVRRWIQIGVRVPSQHQPDFHPNIISCDVDELGSVLTEDYPTYLTIDTDGFDPSIMPGVSYPLARGLDFNDFANILHQLEKSKCRLIGVDWVEFNPTVDMPNGITASAIMSGLIEVLRLIERGATLETS